MVWEAAHEAKALIVSREALRRVQESGDVSGTNRVLQQAFLTDVGPLLASGTGYPET
jgi:L-rhamnose isomerase/sugar isomerase